MFKEQPPVQYLDTFDTSYEVSWSNLKVNMIPNATCETLSTVGSWLGAVFFCGTQDKTLTLSEKQNTLGVICS